MYCGWAGFWQVTPTLPPARVINDDDPSTWPNCTKCRKKPNKYLTEDFVCWECQNVWPNEEEGQQSYIRQDPNPPEEEPARTWPRWWEIHQTIVGPAAWCKKHLQYMPIKGPCPTCKANGLI